MGRLPSRTSIDDQPLASRICLTLTPSAKANCPGAFGSGGGAGGRKGAAARAAAVMKSFSAGLRQATKASLRTGPRSPPDIGESGHRIVEEHDAEARDDSVEATCARTRGSARRLQRIRRSPFLPPVRAPSPKPQAAPEMSSPTQRPGIADAARHRQGRGSGAAADVENAAALAGIAGIDQQPLERRQHLVKNRLQVDPGLAARRRSRARLAEYSASQIASWRTSLSCCSDLSLRALYEFKST